MTASLISGSSTVRTFGLFAARPGEETSLTSGNATRVRVRSGFSCARVNTVQPVVGPEVGEGASSPFRFPTSLTY